MNDNINDDCCNVVNNNIVEVVANSMPKDSELLMLADLYKIFSDMTRVKILYALEQSEMCVCDLSSVLNMSMSAVSHQLKTLRMANLVKYRKAGRVVYYSLADKCVKDILENGFNHVNDIHAY